MHVVHQSFCKDCHTLHPVHCYLSMKRSHETSSSAAQPASKKKALDFDPSGRASGSAAQPAIISSLSGSSAEQPATSLRSFFSSAARGSSNRVAPPAAASSSGSHAASSHSGSAAQPAREAAQPGNALRSITDVQRWLKSNEVALSSSAEAMRIGEVVDALTTLSKAKARRDAIERFFNPWGVQQRIKKDRRPFPELIEELKNGAIWQKTCAQATEKS